MQRIFKYGNIHNTNLTPDTEMNILIYGTLFYVTTYRTYELLNMVRLCPPCITGSGWVLMKQWV